MDFAQISAFRKRTRRQTFLEKMVWERLPKKFDKITPELKDRITYELDIINKKGYSDIFSHRAGFCQLGKK